MSYGSVDSQDTFQVKLDQILEDLKGVVSIADDIVVHQVTEEQYDDNLRNLMKSSQEWSCIQPWQMLTKGRMCHVLWMSVWQEWH